MSNAREAPQRTAITAHAGQRSAFTPSGQVKYDQTVADYSRELLERAAQLGEIAKAPNMSAEVTHEHVRAAAHSIARTFGTPPKSKWMIAANVAEYIAAAVAGVGGGHLDKSVGIGAFGLGLTVAVLLVVVRLTHSKGDA
jgi:hypothetical protein